MQISINLRKSNNMLTCRGVNISAQSHSEAQCSECASDAWSRLLMANLLPGSLAHRGKRSVDKADSEAEKGTWASK